MTGCRPTDLVDEHLDLSRIHAAYTEVRGGPPYDPRLMVRILLYGYTRPACYRPTLPG
jgi:transposase